MWAVQGILAALYERWRTGKGRLVDFAQHDIRKERGVCAAGAAQVRMTGKSWSGKRRLFVPR
jgi:crotonobetainyl-CoA:carnitine CoA-transferase CaiB-like acyl-CoA transferase